MAELIGRKLYSRVWRTADGSEGTSAERGGESPRESSICLVGVSKEKSNSVKVYMNEMLIGAFDRLLSVASCFRDAGLEQSSSNHHR